MIDGFFPEKAPLDLLAPLDAQGAFIQDPSSESQSVALLNVIKLEVSGRIVSPVDPLHGAEQDQALDQLKHGLNRPHNLLVSSEKLNVFMELT